MSHLIDLTGQRFGRLVVLGQAESNAEGQTQWRCECECGNVTLSTSYRLRHGAKTTCGECSKRAPQAEFRFIYSHAKNSAKVRSLVFELTFEQYYDLVTQDCAYCGRPPSISSRQRTGSNGYTGLRNEVDVNGLDRVDSNKGYTVDNVVACCERCNIMKNSLPVNMFLEHVLAIARNIVSL